MAKDDNKTTHPLPTRWERHRSNYAAVAATLALLASAGQPAVAAVKSVLPKHSVGTTQLKPNAVHSSQIARHTIILDDISLGARASLRGATGPQGPAGPAGPAAVTYRASVSAAGALQKGTANGASRNGSPGTYIVSFPGPVDDCSAQANVGGQDSTVFPAAEATTSHIDSKTIGVYTYDANNAAADLPFQLIVAC